MIMPDFGPGALCAEVGGDLWYPEKHDELGGSFDASIRAKEMCERCPLMWECRDWGLRHEEHGIWGGWGEHVRDRERRRLGIKFQRVSLGHIREKGEAA